MSLATLLHGTVVMTAMSAGAAMAQPRQPLSVEAGLVLAHQTGPSGTVSRTYVTAPGGTTTGWLVGLGISADDRFTIAAEWATTGAMTATEASRYFVTFHERRRDRLLTVGARVALPLAAGLALEPMAGLVWTFTTATSRVEYVDPAFPRQPAATVVHALGTGVGPALGISARVGGGRLAVVPSVRILRSYIAKGRYDDTNASPEVDIGSIYPGGYPKWTLRTAIALRAAF